MLDPASQSNEFLWHRVGATASALAAKLTTMSDAIAGVDISGSSKLVGTMAVDVLRPYLHRLTDLNLLGVPIGDAGLSALSCEPAAVNLDTLRVSGPLTRAGLLALAGSSHLPSLRRLQIDDAELSHEVWTTLLGSPSVAQLTTLVLARADVGEAALSALETTRSLDTLVLDRCTLRGWGPRLMSRTAAMQRLVRLGIPRNDLDLQDITTLADAAFPHLHTLDLADNVIDVPAARAIRDRRGMPTLALVVLGRETSVPTGRIEDYYDHDVLVSQGVTYLDAAGLKASYFADQPIDFIDEAKLSFPDKTARWFSAA